MEETLGEIGITGTPAVDLYVAVAAGARCPADGE